MIHNSARESAFNRSAELPSADAQPKPSRRSHDAIIKLRKKIADVRERANPCQIHRYYHSTRQPVLPNLTGEDRESSARQPSPQELAERAAIVLALNITSGKRPSQS